MPMCRSRRSASAFEHEIAQRAGALDRLRMRPPTAVRRRNDEALANQAVDLPLTVHRHKTCDGLAVVGHDELLASMHELDQPAQIGAELTDAYFHGTDCSAIARTSCSDMSASAYNARWSRSAS